MDNRRSLALGVAGLFSAFLWSLESPSLALDPVINEFLASNQKTLADENGDSSDWIEIYTPGPSDLPLNGWYLTDDPAALQKWRFPSVTMAAGGYLVVFASGKNRIDPASELHTNFKLDASGEYLALIKPDGLTVAQEFAPHYPPQREDISYGIGEEVVGAKLVGDGALAKFFVPADDALGLKWTGAPED